MLRMIVPQLKWKGNVMNWTANPAPSSSLVISDLPAKIGKAGATESVAIVAVIWLIVIAANS